MPRSPSRPRTGSAPPYAQDELAFLLACTRCGACVTACPHGVIFPLAPRLGITVAGTPALDLLHKGCHLCEDGRVSPPANRAR
jgi:ferredoxin-type protein NapG